MAAVTLGTVAGTVLGTLAVPPDQRLLAARLFVGAIVGIATIGLFVSVFHHTFVVANLREIGGSIIGGFIALKACRRMQARSISS
jgi:hypothetical protein